MIIEMTRLLAEQQIDKGFTFPQASSNATIATSGRQRVTPPHTLALPLQTGSFEAGVFRYVSLGWERSGSGGRGSRSDGSHSGNYAPFAWVD
ncbi:hypothetical protein L5876_09940 [Hyphobacterium sp. SN044]|uniref:hypothetical protein n=1 Tax=Hyphobacterium sp. SN044 TaxID=2912575 RepID=UPI001F1B70BB|nr:hypothetical protein [Hyphobacterium sp. SN044]MCF8880136.1 hypothetical protein [Hyphobacterium sp. SN044]